MKPTCKNCAKSERNGGHGCDNYDLRPQSLCFIPLDEVVARDEMAADLEADRRAGK